MKLTSKYLDFQESLSVTKKTKIITIFPKSHGDVLGQIRWHGAWRRYCFFPSNDCLYDKNCLSDIILCIDWLTNERK